MATILCTFVIYFAVVEFFVQYILGSMATSTPSKDTTAMSSSTPLSRKQACKRKMLRGPGSESSIEGDLSYLDLDTGRIQTAIRQDEGVVLTVSEFDKMMTKLEMMQLKFDKLDKLDKLDAIEKCVRDMNVKVRDLESRVTKTETATLELQQSVTFISDQ